MVDPGFPFGGGGADPLVGWCQPPTCTLFGKNVCKKRKKLILLGGSAPPLDPPMLMARYHVQYRLFRNVKLNYYRLAEQVDAFTSVHTGLTLIVHMVGLCFVLYNLICEYDTLKNDVMLLGRTAFWLVTVLLAIFGELIIAARVNSMVSIK